MPVIIEWEKKDLKNLRCVFDTFFLIGAIILWIYIPYKFLSLFPLIHPKPWQEYFSWNLLAPSKRTLVHKIFPRFFGLLCFQIFVQNYVFSRRVHPITILKPCLGNFTRFQGTLEEQLRIGSKSRNTCNISNPFVHKPEC